MHDERTPPPRLLADLDRLCDALAMCLNPACHRLAEVADMARELAQVCATRYPDLAASLTSCAHTLDHNEATVEANLSALLDAVDGFLRRYDRGSSAERH